jgi:hypothetical protein
MANPFPLGVINPGEPFCNRHEEIKRLADFARGRANVTILSPRRFGKTSLVHRVQHELSQEKMLTIYVDLHRVTSVDEVARRIARSVYRELNRHQSLLKKASLALRAISAFRPVLRPTESGVDVSVEPGFDGRAGMEILESTLEDLGKLINEQGSAISIALDEFQDIADLKNPEVEGVLRSHIQRHRASYFFVGSRRSILLDMFSNEKRPFFNSSFTFPLGPLPLDELADFISQRFAKGGKTCPKEVASRMSEMVEGHPHYARKLAFLTFELAPRRATEETVQTALTTLVQDETPFFEATLRSLTLKQVRLLEILASSPTKEPYSAEFLKTTGLSQGTIQAALRTLQDEDLVEHDRRTGAHRPVDPILALWLKTGRS